MIHDTTENGCSTTAETDRIVRRLSDEDLPDPEAEAECAKVEAFNKGFNAGLEMSAALVRLNQGDKKLAALLLRQRKYIGEGL